MKIIERNQDPASAGHRQLAELVSHLQRTLESTEERARRTERELSTVRSDLIRVALVAGGASPTL
ncbi:MAG: hypothetical protein ABI595_14280 [Actinomycetota bacterium]